MTEYKTIAKNLKPVPSLDYTLLRSRGIEHLEKLSRELWTDYNTHDPGITILELLAYAITDLGYRTDFHIKDILTDDPNSGLPPDKQFFTAKEILPCNPLTINDWRKVIIDIEGVKNAWMLKAKQEIDFWASCGEDKLVYEDEKEENDKKVVLNGLYDILVEFEVYDDIGDLNDNTFNYKVKMGDLMGAMLQVTLPMWYEIDTSWVKDFKVIEVILSNYKTDKHKNRYKWDIKIKCEKGITVKTIALGKMFVDYSNKKKVTNIKSKLEAELKKTDKNSIIQLYQKKIQKTLDIIKEVKKVFHAHRNLCEDLVNVKNIETDDIVICADIEVKPEADIDKILSEIYFLVKQYLSPDIRFYSLEEMVKSGKPSEKIFEGPVLKHGFIDNDELEKSGLREVVYTSDLISIIMDIEGVVAVKSLLISNYDTDGEIIIDSQKWIIKIRENHKPRLNIDKSKIVFYKGIIPYYVNKDEVMDLLKILEAQYEKSKLISTADDFEIPKGTYRELDEYYTIQHEFPLCYGTGTDGPPSGATVQRKAQIKQLKAYLLFYDQLLANYLVQLANVKKLFSMDSSIKASYFSNLLENNEIADIEQLYVNKTVLQSRLTSLSANSLIEDENLFYDRRNRFLDHLLARFCEKFTDYVLLMYDIRGDRDEEEIIADKLAFLTSYPEISRDRGKAFNYKDSANIWNTGNVSGLEKRVSRLLGIKNFNRRFLAPIPSVVELFQTSPPDAADEFRFRIKDGASVLLTSIDKYKQGDALNETIALVLRHSRIRDDFDVILKTPTKFRINLFDDDDELIAENTTDFPSYNAASDEIDKIVKILKEKVEDEGMHLVEHILLRPKSVGDKLFHVCLSDDCGECSGSFDPYSFRITIVLPYWTDRFFNMNFRRFVEQVIRTETPAHIYVKICWVDFEDMDKFEKAYKLWLEENAKEIPDKVVLSARLKALIEAMEALRNVYPEATLFDCEGGSDSNPTLLNNTILGTIKSE